ISNSEMRSTASVAHEAMRWSKPAVARKASLSNSPPRYAYPTLACGENFPKCADTIPSPRAAHDPEPSKSSSLPVGNRVSARMAIERGSPRWRLTFARAITSPSPVEEPSTNRDAVSTGFVGVPPKKCSTGGGPNGSICATLLPVIDVFTSGTTTPKSIRSVMPYVSRNEVTVRFTLRSRFRSITSFSTDGIPRSEQSPLTIWSQPGKSTLAWVKVNFVLLRSTPRKVLNCKPLRVTVASTRPRPSVWARSAKIGPVDVEVRTGTPPWKLKVDPPLAAVTGRFATALPTELVRKLMTVALLALAEGMKCDPCN